MGNPAGMAGSTRALHSGFLITHQCRLKPGRCGIDQLLRFELAHKILEDDDHWIIAYLVADFVKVS